MQKVLQRTAHAERQAARRFAKQKEHFKKAEAFRRHNERQRVRKDFTATIKEARKNRAEDWALGPLAPRRDVGERAESYGTVSTYNINPPEREEQHRPEWWSIREGDRVVVVRGKEKGRISVVRNVVKESATVSLDGVNIVDVQLPEWMINEENSEVKITGLPLGMPIEDCRLVFPLPDPETGVPRDVIIDRLEPINREWDEVKREWTDGERVIPGTNTIIPWPPTLEPEYEQYDSDTPRITVDDPTYRPFLLHPPMPLTVIDELRNKYSKFRTRHDYDYVQKMEAREARIEKRKGLIKGMRTPLQELADLRKAQKEAAGPPTLTDAQLEKIGKIIAREQKRTGHTEHQVKHGVQSRTVPQTEA